MELVLDAERGTPPPQLLKWVGNKQRYAPQIIRAIPTTYNRYFEPFLGSGAVLGGLAPCNAVAGDVLEPLISFWKLVKSNPAKLTAFYASTWLRYMKDRTGTYLATRNSFNSSPNPFDLLFLSRACYGGVVRFTKAGTMSTPIGAHSPIPPERFRERVQLWNPRLQGTDFLQSDFEEIMARAKKGDVVYCDPPYVHCQAILYGAQSFELARLWTSIEQCVSRGAKVLLSIDGSKQSGKLILDVGLPHGLFKRQVMINCGRSMLRRFQKVGETLEGEIVEDRLLLTW